MCIKLCTFWNYLFPLNSYIWEYIDRYRRHRRCGFDPWVGKIHCSRKWQPTPVFLPGKFHGQRSLEGYSPWVSKSWTPLSNWAHTHTCIYFLFVYPEGSLTVFFDLTMVYLFIPLFRDSWIVSQIFLWKHCCSECSCSCLLCTQASISLGCSPANEKAALRIHLPTAFLDIVNLFSKAGASIGAFPISSI